MFLWNPNINLAKSSNSPICPEVIDMMAALSLAITEPFTTHLLESDWIQVFICLVFILTQDAITFKKRRRFGRLRLSFNLNFAKYCLYPTDEGEGCWHSIRRSRENAIQEEENKTKVWFYNQKNTAKNNAPKQRKLSKNCGNLPQKLEIFSIRLVGFV